MWAAAKPPITTENVETNDEQHSGKFRAVLALALPLGLALVASAGERPVVPAAGYAGREADAAWRKAALERIEKIRKGDLKVTVTDAAGSPLAGAAVSVKMQRQAYAFGSAVAAKSLLARTPDSEQYRDHVKRLFNRVVLENDLKWPEWERNRRPAEEAVKWLREQGIEVRGHNLVWPNWNVLPGDLSKLKDRREELRAGWPGTLPTR